MVIHPFLLIFNFLEVNKIMKKIILVSIISIVLILNMSLISIAEEKPNFHILADSILQAEGNDNYGVLKRFKKTSPRQACINTCMNSYKRWASNSKLRASYESVNKDFIDYLNSTYAPINALNDPGGLNKNWARNVRYWYRQFNKQAESAQ